MRVEVGKLSREPAVRKVIFRQVDSQLNLPVVLPHPDRVVGGEPRLLVGTRVSGLEAPAILGTLLETWNLAFFSLSLSLLLRQEAFLRGSSSSVCPQQSSAIFPKLPVLLLVAAVDVAGILQVGDLVHLLSVSKGALLVGTRHRPYKVHTPLVVPSEERVVDRDVDWEALGMENKTTDWSRTVFFTTLDS